MIYKFENVFPEYFCNINKLPIGLKWKIFKEIFAILHSQKDTNNYKRVNSFHEGDAFSRSWKSFKKLPCEDYEFPALVPADMSKTH
jgi:hypothetical protein